MAKRFGAQHTASGYAAMGGGAAARPRYAQSSGLTVAESIARARRAVAAEAKRRKTSK